MAAAAVLASVQLQAAVPTVAAAQPSKPSVRVEGLVETDPKLLVENDPTRDWFDWAIGFAQIGAGAGVAAIVRQVRAAQRDARIQRSLSFLQRYQEGNPRFLTGVVNGYLNVSDPAACVALIEAFEKAPNGDEKCLPAGKRTTKTTSKNEIRELLDFFEEIGVAYNQKLLDTEVLSRTIGAASVRLFSSAWWFVLWRREETKSPTTYLELEKMATSLRDKYSNLEKKGKPAPSTSKPAASIRLLALPTKGEQEREKWDLCARLSKALSERAAPDPATGIPSFQEDVGRIVVSQPESPDAELVARLIAIPLDIGQAQPHEAKLLSELSKLDPNGVAKLIKSLQGESSTVAPGSSGQAPGSSGR